MKNTKNSKKRWTTVEENVLKKYIQENPVNLTQTFLLISKKLNRSVQGVRQHYYYMAIDKDNAMFTVASKKFMTVNRKCEGKKLRVKCNNRSFIHMFRQFITRFFNN